jgi:dihydrolipoamide dehydrogenase
MADLIIIGAGPGGYETAVKAAEAGLEVVIIEKEQLGGTCLNAGCIPTKCLCHTAETLDLVREISSVALPETANELLEKAIRRKNEVVERLRDGVSTLMKTPGITLVFGEARFRDARSVQVGETVYTAKNIIIATGSITKYLPIEGAHAAGVITSAELLNMSAFPENPLPDGTTRLCIIGGGVIGMEFASVYRSFGIDVEVIEYCKEILPAFDRDIAKRLRTSLKKRGVNIHVGSAAKKITPADMQKGRPRMTVTFEEKGKEQTVDCELVLMAVGRAANVEALNLDEIGINYTSKGITVDDNMQTNIEGIYAVGDINGLCQLAHAASFQGMCALEHILNKGETYKESLKTIPSAVFTVPEAASVGQTEEQLKDAGVEYKTLKSFYRTNGKALSLGADDGMVKLLVTDGGYILGAHILGAHASDLIHEVAVVMRHGGKVGDISGTVHAHPSLSEIVLDAARRF